MITGVIGTGNMGTILVEALIESKAIHPKNLLVANRSPHKAAELVQKYKGITMCETNVELVNQSDLIFICLKPLDIHQLLTTIKPFVKPHQCIVSITSPVSTSQLQTLLACSCARMIPSITNRALAGASLLSFGTNCSDEWQDQLLKICTHFSTPVEIDPRFTRVTSDIVSCGPAFFSYLAQAFVEGAVSETGINKQQATELTEQMLIGLGELISKGYYTLPTLQEKVCVKGGITGEGIKVLETEVSETFKNLFRATHTKFREDIQLTEDQFKSDYY